MQIQLSISVLISDRPETVSKCLNSLLPILQNIPSELIAVCTGKENESMEIAKRYTDQIIPFEWCDDFSRARNVGLEVSKGQWFMYIDDDEWFEDCGEIVEFFKSGAYKDYHSACYLVRNYDDFEGKKFSDTYAARMIERHSDSKFIGFIHESFNEFLEPVQYFTCYAHHFGYVVEEGAGKTIRTERNIPLLKKQLEEEPDGVRSHIQLAQEYFRAGNYEETTQWCRKILERGRTKGIDNNFDWAATFLIRALMAEENENEALIEGGRLLEDAGLSEIYRMEMYIYLTAPCFNKGKYKNGVAYGRDFIRLKQELEKDSDKWDQQQLLLVNRGNILKRSNYVYSNAILCAVLSQDFDSLEYILKEFSWDDVDDLDKMYQFWDNGKRFFDLYRKEFLTAFSKVDSENSYVLFQKALYYEMMKDYEKTEELYFRCQKDLRYLMSSQVILMAIRNNFVLPDFMDEIDLDDWRGCAQAVAENFDIENQFENMLKAEALFECYPVHKLVLKQKVLTRVLFDKNLTQREFINTLNQYCSVVLTLNHLLYKEELFEIPMQFCLPKECRVALKFQKIFESINEKTVKEVTKLIKELIDKYPELSYLAGRVIDYIRDTCSDNPLDGSGQEFYETGKKVKEYLKKLAENEQFEEALAVAEELSRLMPTDAEVTKYLQLLRRMV